MGDGSVNVVIRIKGWRNSMSSSQILSAIVYGTSHFFSENLRKGKYKSVLGHWSKFFHIDHLVIKPQTASETIEINQNFLIIRIVSDLRISGFSSYTWRAFFWLI